MKSKIIVLLLFCLAINKAQSQEKQNVFIFTDINIDSGDPDDRQSLVHLLWYADELDIKGIVPERWDAEGYEACKLAVDRYSKDYVIYKLYEAGYPRKEVIEKVIAGNKIEAEKLFCAAANDNSKPLYVLVWGNMLLFNNIIMKYPELSDGIRVITIGTNLMLEDNIKYLPENWKKFEKPCEQNNWNGFGRNEIFSDNRFKKMWWLEINWTYNGMFTGDEPKEMFHKLSKYGNLGSHLTEVVKNEEWAQYFRVGDTPSVLYVIDKSHDHNDPTKSSWAGTFVKPFPIERPNYYTDSNGDVEWNFSDPCATWQNHVKVYQYAKSTLEERRSEMYDSLLNKLDKIYINRN